MIGATNINALFVMFMGLAKDLKHTEASFLLILMDLLCLRIAQVPVSSDLVIFVLTTTIDIQTDHFTFAHACGVIKLYKAMHAS